MGDEEFVEVAINGLDKQATSKVSDVLWDVYLRLEPEAPFDWGQIFIQEWARVIYNMKRGAHTTGKFLVIEKCGLDEVDKYHLKHLEDAVARTNAAYREAKGLEVAAELRREGEEAADQAELDELERRLEDR